MIQKEDPEIQRYAKYKDEEIKMMLTDLRQREFDTSEKYYSFLKEQFSVGERNYSKLIGRFYTNEFIYNELIQTMINHFYFHKNHIYRHI